jgi:hypothetical protein
MANVSDENRCVAITRNGDRCSRVAKEGQFCFQHDSSYDTVDEYGSDSANIFNVVSDQAYIPSEELSGVKRDIAQNMEDVYNSVKDASGALTSMDFDKAMQAFRDAAGSTAATSAKYAAVGGTAGSIGGPAGFAAGATVGAWYGVYDVANDDRSIRAQVVEQVDDDIEIVSSDDPAIADVEPIQLALQSGVETQQKKTEWLRSTVFRDRNMDQVEEAFEQIPAARNQEGGAEYYIEYQPTGEILRVVFGEPVEN